MKKALALLLTTAALFGLTSCGQSASGQPDSGSVDAGSVNTVPEKAPLMEMAEDLDPNDGADLAAGAYDHADSEYYGHPDFYNMKNSDRVTIIENYQSLQQTNAWTCGCCAVLSALNHFGVDKYTEWDLAVAMKTSTDMDVEGAEPGSANSWYEMGNSLSNLMRFLEDCPELKVVETNYKPEYAPDELVTEADTEDFSYNPLQIGNAKRTFSTMSLYTSDNDPASENYVDDAKDSYFVKWLTGHLSAGRPIMVHNNFWNGHWVALIGYDNMGTPAISDDMLIFADPWDTSDHWQDGYTYRPLEEFFFAQWQDMNWAAKPYQLQSYIVLDKAS